MNNQDHKMSLTDDLKRLDRARKAVETSLIYQDLNDDGIFICQSSKDPKMFYIQNFRDDGLLSCGCPDCKYRSKECKHICEIKIKLLAKSRFKQIDIKKMISDQNQYDTIILDLDSALNQGNQ
jgi:hypothetical protein